MTLQEVYTYLNNKAKERGGKVTLSAELHNHKIIVTMPKTGIHIFAISAHTMPTKEQLDKHFGNAMRVLGETDPATL